MSSLEKLVEDPKPRRRGRIPGAKVMPKHAPRPVSEIWRAATDDSRDMAKRQAGELLSYWRGLVGSRDVAGRLGVKQNMVYLLQQRALAGMVAGLLPSPKLEKGAKVYPIKSEIELLRKEVGRLTKERDALTGLVRLLRNLPDTPRNVEASKHATKQAKKKTRSDRDPERNGGMDGAGEAHGGGETNRRQGARRIGKNIEKLED